MTNRTKLQELDDRHEAFTILEGNLRFAINDVKEHQRTLELILLAQGLLDAFPGAGLLRVEVRDGIAVPVSLTDKPEWTARNLATLEVPEPSVIAQGRTLEWTDIEGWILTELLKEISLDSDGSWINRVDALPDIDTDYNDPRRGLKTEFDIDLAKTAALPVPVPGPATVWHVRDERQRRPEESTVARLRAGLLEEYPNAYRLYIRYSAGKWQVQELVDSNGMEVCSGERLEEQPIPGGGWVSQAVASLVEDGYISARPCEGSLADILMAPPADGTGE